MIPLLLFLAILNALILMIFLISRNQPASHPPYRLLLVIFGTLNIATLALATVTGFSVAAFITDWTTVFPQSLESWYVYSIGFMILFTVIIFPFLAIQLKQLFLPSNRKYMLIGIIFIVIAVTIWLPFGFDHAGHWEIWTIRRYLMFGPPSFTTDEMVTRVSSRIPHTLAHLISPNSLQGHFIIHFVFFPIKGILIFAILKKLGVDDRFALFTALLGMLYPSQTQVMSVRLHSQIMRVSIFLLAFYAFLMYMEKPQRLTLSAFFIAMYFSVTSIEYPLILIAAFAIVVIYQNRQSVAKVVNLLAIWCVMPFAYVCYFVLVSLHFTSYASNQFLISLPEIVISNFLSLYVHLVYNWSQVLPQDMMPVYVLIAIVLAGGVGLMSRYLDRAQPDKKLKAVVFRMLLGGIVIICGTLIFSIFPAYSQSFWRIYTYSSIGAAIVVVSFVQIVVLAIWTPRVSGTFVVICSVLVGLAYNNTIHQYQRLWDVAQNKVEFLKFTPAIDVISANAQWVFLTDDTSSQFQSKLDPFQFEFVRDDALYVSMGAIGFDQSYICYLPDRNCQFGENTVDIDSQQAIVYEDIVFFWINPDLTVERIDTGSDKLSDIGLETDRYYPLNFIQVKAQSS